MSEIRIDAYMLTIDEPEEWRDAAVLSLANAQINLHMVQTNRSRTIGADMAWYFSNQGCPYAAIVDPDNIYEPSAFALLSDALERNASATLAYTDETAVDKQGVQIAARRLAYSRYAHAHSPSLVHSLVVYRREAIKEHLAFIEPFHVYAEWMLTLRLARVGPILHLPITGRHWRQHPAQAHLKPCQTELTAIRQELRNHP